LLSFKNKGKIEYLKNKIIFKTKKPGLAKLKLLISSGVNIIETPYDRGNKNRNSKFCFELNKTKIDIINDNNIINDLIIDILFDSDFNIKTFSLKYF
jgi:hypothetical protein